jgi:hypothetical protein
MVTRGMQHRTHRFALRTQQQHRHLHSEEGKCGTQRHGAQQGYAEQRPCVEEIAHKRGDRKQPGCCANPAGPQRCQIQQQERRAGEDSFERRALRHASHRVSGQFRWNARQHHVDAKAATGPILQQCCGGEHHSGTRQRIAENRSQRFRRTFAENARRKQQQTQRRIRLHRRRAVENSYQRRPMREPSQQVQQRKRNRQPRQPKHCTARPRSGGMTRAAGIHDQSFRPSIASEVCHAL